MSLIRKLNFSIFFGAMLCSGVAFSETQLWVNNDIPNFTFQVCNQSVPYGGGRIVIKDLKAKSPCTILVNDPTSYNTGAIISASFAYHETDSLMYFTVNQGITLPSVTATIVIGVYGGAIGNRVFLIRDNINFPFSIPLSPASRNVVEISLFEQQG